FGSPPFTSTTGAPWATQFMPLPPLLAVVVVVVGSVAVSSPSLKPVTTRIHPIVLSPPTEPQRFEKEVVALSAGTGKNVKPVTESAATECALGCRHSGGWFALTGAKLLMPVSRTRVPASMMPSDCRPVGQLPGVAGGPAFDRARK